MSRQLTNNDGGKRPGPAAAGARQARILVMDGDQSFRAELQKFLGRFLKNAVFGGPAEADAALDGIQKDSWDVALLEMDSFGKHGMDRLRRVVKALPGRPVVVLTGRSQSRFAEKVMHAGAVGCVLKKPDMQEILACLRSAMAGEPYISPALMGTPASLVNTRDGQGPQDVLSEREYQVLKLIALGKSVKEIAFELELSAKTVNTYRTRIMDKANLKTTADIIRYSAQEKLADSKYLDGGVNSQSN